MLPPLRNVDDVAAAAYCWRCSVISTKHGNPTWRHKQYFFTAACIWAWYRPPGCYFSLNVNMVLYQLLRSIARLADTESTPVVFNCCPTYMSLCSHHYTGWLPWLPTSRHSLLRIRDCIYHHHGNQPSRQATPSASLSTNTISSLQTL